MRDEMDARIWNHHHDLATPSTGQARAARTWPAPPEAPRQLLVGMAALLLSLASLGATIA